MKVIDLGTLDYQATWDIQKQWHAKVVAREEQGCILFVEHPPVITLGKNATNEYVKATSEMLQKINVQLIQSDRGGNVTGHFPGQIVVYPILHLGDMNLPPKKYVELLEQSMIETLESYGILAARDEINPGVWVGLNKIGAVGIRVKDRVSMHGLALNVTTDLSYFNLITPCGIIGRGVTSIQKEIEKTSNSQSQVIDISKVKNLLKDRLLTILQFR